MNHPHFEAQIERLRKVYSPAALNEERIALLWNSFKRVPDRTFEQAVNYLIGEATTQALPAMSRFQEAVARFSQRSEGGASHEQNKSRYKPCKRCNREGVVFARHREPPHGAIVFKCSCEASELFKARAQVWDDTLHLQSYILDEVYPEITSTKTPQQLAEEYGPKIRALFRRGVGQPLPYDKNERISEEETCPF